MQHPVTSNNWIKIGQFKIADAEQIQSLFNMYGHWTTETAYCFELGLYPGSRYLNNLEHCNYKARCFKYFVYISLLAQVFMSENWANYTFLRWREDLDSWCREDLDSCRYPIPAHVPFQIFQKANTWKSNQIKEPQNDKWNNRQCFELLLHILNKCTGKKNRNLGKSRSTCHQIKLGQPGKVEKIGDD